MSGTFWKISKIRWSLIRYSIKEINWGKSSNSLVETKRWWSERWRRLKSIMKRNTWNEWIISRLLTVMLLKIKERRSMRSRGRTWLKSMSRENTSAKKKERREMSKYIWISSDKKLKSGKSWKIKDSSKKKYLRNFNALKSHKKEDSSLK